MTDLDPIYVSVRKAAEMLAISTWSTYKLLDSQRIESRYHGSRRLVLVSSLREYAESLPSTAPSVEAS